MTDMSIENANATQVAPEGIYATVQKTLAKRYAAERRFRAYGLIAIGLALAFLGFLFTDIISKGISAFWQTQVKIEVTLDADKVDPKGDGSADSLRAGDFRTLVRDGFRAYFPDVSGRKDRRALMALLSSGAEYTVRDMVQDDPSLIGQTISVWVSLSDDADVYAKGHVTKISSRTGNGIASPTGVEGDIQILFTANDFSQLQAEIKRDLQAQAETLERNAQRLNGRIAGLEGDIQSGTGDVDQLKSDLEASLREQADLREQAAERRARAEDMGGEEALSADLPSFLIGINGGIVKINSVGASQISGTVLTKLASTDDAAAGDWDLISYETPETARRLNDKEVTWLHQLETSGVMVKNFNTTLFTAGDSREPEQAGILGAVVGSFYTLLVTLLLSFPIGVMTAVYLEEFAPKNRLTDLVEVNINNLAAVPSIVFGLLGLAVFLNFFGLPRSAPLVGGLVLTLMTLPTIIIASRAALKAVPPSIREAALGMGASRLQAMTHHILPLALPGMLTGTIIGMAQALGETAPLLMIGMIAFIVDIPGGPTDPSTVLPVQVYLWADSPERAFVERTSAAIMVLLGFLITMNLLAVLLRRRFERRW